MSSGQWFSVDSGAHLRKISGFHHHQPGGFLLDLIRVALRRGAKRIRIDLTPGCLRISDNAPVPNRETLAALQDLAGPGISETHRERLIHELLSPPGIGWLAVFTPQPRQVTVQLRRGTDCRHFAIFPGARAAENQACALPAAMNTMVSILEPRLSPPPSVEWVRQSCRAAPAVIEINGNTVQPNHLLPDTFLARRLPYGQARASAVLAVPATGETCRLVFTDRGIPWEELNLPPREGLVFHLQVEHLNPPEPGFISQWLPGARRLYALAAAEFAHLSPDNQRRMEELFFLLHRRTGDDRLFRHAPIFPQLGRAGHTSLAELETRGKRGCIYFRLQHNSTPYPKNRSEPVLLLASRQLDFLSRKGLRLSKVPDPVIIQDSFNRRILQHIRAAVAHLMHLLYARSAQIPLERLSKEERGLVEWLIRALSKPGPGSLPGRLPPAWHPVVLDCRGWSPLWPGPRLGGLNFRDLVFARRHPRFRAAARRLHKAPQDNALIAAAFRPLVWSAGVRKN